MAVSYDVNSLFHTTLCIRKPWQLERVSLNKKEGRLRVDFTFDQLGQKVCPLCRIGHIKRPSSIQKMWCHLNFFQYETYMTVQIPLLSCNNSGCVAHNDVETVINTLFLDALLMVSPFDTKHVLGTLLATQSCEEVK